MYSKLLLLLPPLLLLLPTLALAQAFRSFTTHFDKVAIKVEVIASGLDTPWSVAFGPEEEIYITERSGSIKVLEKGAREPSLLYKISEVYPSGEGGLMGLTLHPKFEKTNWLYVCYTTSGEGKLINRVVRFKLKEDGGLEEKTIILDRIPGAQIHDGCRLKFGPDGKLYVTTGDASQKKLAQDKKSLAGKILRLNEDGTIPLDNPFPQSPIYSLGHRNPQGLDWHPDTQSLLATEHGPSGWDGPGGGDEVNLIFPGKNYGWPILHHKKHKKGFQPPLLLYTPAIAPSGACFYKGTLFSNFHGNFFFATLRGKHIQRIILQNGIKPKKRERLLKDEYGRLRDIQTGPDGALYVLTSNRDGRGAVQADDDRLLKLTPLE
ncbi:MAG: PQQ-dependent sugar dehydrogenase [Elusimicrobia bacterium]|nr:PQQ-dependent sugar dehydrogenase [Elusimicrobiota bacterium]